MNGFAPLLAALALAQGAPQQAAETDGPQPAPATPSPAAPAVPTTPSTTATPTATPIPIPAATPTRTPAATPTRAPARRAPRDPAAERDEAERVARAFLQALAAGDADVLASASAERFSFDGEIQAGRDAIRRTWRTLLADRDGPVPRVGAVEVLSVADAVERLGKPPARIAPLARPGVLVAVADVGGRSVVLFLARDGDRMAVVGMHD